MDTGRHKRPKGGNDTHAPGRVVIDSRGRNVWQWSDDQLDSTTIMLKRLDNADLALEPTRRVRKPDLSRERGAVPGRSGSDARDQAGHRDAGTIERSGTLSIEQTIDLDPGGGFDPYNKT